MDSPVIKATIPCPPPPTARPRIITVGGRPRLGKTKPLKQWEKEFSALFAEHAPEFPLSGPLWVTVLVVKPRPQRLRRKKDPDGRIWSPVKPDIDNYVKVIFDLLTTMGYWEDDDQVCVVCSSKVYADKSEGPCIEISVGQLSN